MKRTFAVVLTILSIALFAEKVTLNENSKLFEHTTLSENNTLINFTLDGYITEDISQDNTPYKRISYPGEGDFAIPGKPDLPNFSRTFAIPDQGSVRLNITDIQEEIISNIVVYPRQELKIDEQPVSTDFTVNSDYYENGKVFPEQMTIIGEPAVMRDFRVVTVSVNPFQYDPKKKELRIIKNLELELVCEGSGGVNTKTTDHKSSRFFEPMYKSSIENYETLLNRDEDFQQPSYLFIYPDNGSVETYLGYLTDWKRRKGFEVYAASTAETGTSSFSIKSYIQDAYDTWENPPEFICLVGDTNGSFGVASATSGYGGSDHPYTQLEGNDILADASIGRLSFSSLTQFQTILNKILQYEMTPYMDEPDWFNKVCLVGDPGSSGPSVIVTNKNIKETMLYYFDDFVFHEQYSGGFSSFMNNRLDEGVGYFNYRGYIGMSGWSPGNNYNNGPMMPNAVIITCGTGSFADGTSTSETFLRQGTPTVPKGAVTAIGTATSSTHTMFNNCVDMGIFYSIFREHTFNMGGALVCGKLNLYNTYGNTSPGQTQNFSEWNNLMGDPGMEVWTGIPEELVVTHDADVAVGTNYLDVSVSNNSREPLAGAWVTMLGADDETVFATGYTDENGNISIPLNSDYSGDCYLTVTSHDFIPYLGEFTSSASGMFVNVSDITIDDDNSGDSSGNDDGLINPGEDVELRIYLENFGTNTANGIVAEISCEQDFITISDNTESYGNITGGAVGFSSDDFDISVAEDVLGGTDFVLDITITSSNRTTWTDHLILTVDGATLSVDSYSVDDGNNDTPEPGETFELTVEIANLGSVTAENVSGVLACSNDDIVIDDLSGYFGNIEADGTGNNNGNTFTVTAGTTIIPGSIITFELTLSNGNGYNDTITFNMQVGDVSIADPLGPDAYGYYAYDDEDTNYYNAPIYNWVEIDPNYGGSGTMIPLSDNGNTGDIEVIDLPFSFRMYGQAYNEITVCSNGWIAPGVTEEFSFMNWNIPGPGGPSPIIAVFWDDLKMSNGDVYYYYDAAQHRFIVEWSHLRNDFADDEETFQAILYDPNYSPTALGDSEILFQYQEINNTSQGSCDNYPMDHGQYCTIGLEDPSGLIGLEYTFNNVYPSAAKHLEDEMAILLTGPPVTLEEPFIVLGSINITDENNNGNVDYGENVQIDVSLNNLGQNAATGVAATISTTDENITIINEVSSYPDIEGGTSEMNVMSFDLDIAADCPDDYSATFEINIDCDQDTWTMFFILDLNAPVLHYSSAFIDDGGNNLLDPGETTDIFVMFSNTGGAAAYNVVAEISSSDELVTLNSVTYDVGTMSEDNIVTAIFNVTADESTEIGHIATINWLLSGDLDIESSGYFSLSVSQVPVYLEEHFETFPPQDWYTEGGPNWHLGTGNNAGGAAPEAEFYYSNGVGIQRLVTMPMVTSGSTTLEVEFKHVINDFSGNGYVLRLETTSDGINWNTVTSWPAETMPATTEIIEVETPDVGSETFQLAWTYDGDFWDINWWNIDDVYIQSGNPQIMGSISGTLELSGGEGDITQCEIEAGSFIVHPNNSGNYILPLEVGTYDVTASLTGYEFSIQSDVEVLPNEDTNVDFTLTFMEQPYNLTADVTDNNVELNWEIPVLLSVSNQADIVKNTDKRKETKSNAEVSSAFTRNARNDRIQTGYRIYRDDEEIAMINDVGIFTYTDEEVENGDYEYHVTSVYETGESGSSNIVEVTVDFTDAEEVLIPAITALVGNYPNPFNPTTTINYQLSKASNIEIVVYNLKGQKVRTLLDSQKSAGYHNAMWNGRDNSGNSVSSGIYFYEMKTEDYSDIRKMILLK